jgi:lysophospholipase L1-like esterase
MRPDGRWIATWTASPQPAGPGDLPPAPFTNGTSTLGDCTLRQTLHTSIGGAHLRLGISNAFGRRPVTIGHVSVALPAGGTAGVSGVDPVTCRPVRFAGRAAVTVPAGALAVSDPVRLDVTPLSDLTVTAYLPEGVPVDALTSHPGSRTTSYLVPGEHVADTDLVDAVPVEHWYLLGSVDVTAGPEAGAVVALGDSLTDGRGSTTDGNDRWTDQLAARLHASNGGCRTAVLNQALGGNRVLEDGVGPSALARLDRDVLAQGGVRHLIVCEGINDIGTAEASEAAQRRVRDDLIGAYRQIVVRARTHGIAVHCATLTPFGGNPDYDDPAGARESSRQAVNTWIRGGGWFDGVLDFDLAVRDPAAPGRLLPEADCGDHLHLTPAGYRLLAEAVPVERFVRRQSR